jgi:hypothetical protein
MVRNQIAEDKKTLQEQAVQIVKGLTQIIDKSSEVLEDVTKSKTK